MRKKPPPRQIFLDPAPTGELRCIGGSDHDVWNKHLTHLLGAAVPEAGRANELTSQAMSAAVSALISMKPSDPVEATLVAQLVAANATSLELLRRSWLAGQPYEISAKYIGLADRAARTVATLAETLTRYRTAGKQVVVVQHVNVAEGGQAVVAGQITGRGEHDEEQGQPHALDARGPALHSAFEADGLVVPRAGSHRS